MGRKQRNSLFFGLATAALLIGHGCSNVRLVPTNTATYSSTAANVSLCTTPANTVKSGLKFIFVVDRSGSNQKRYVLNPATGVYDPLPGTDPSGIRRFSAILQFVQSYTSDPNIYWSMVNFSDDVLSGSNYQKFTNDQTSFHTFVQNQQANTTTIDGGDTNYVAAVNFVKLIISNDIAAAKLVTPAVSSNYVVFFISDGAPIVSGVLQPGSNVTSVVGSTIAYQQSDPIYVDGIQFNTGFYGAAPVDPTAAQLLKDMATAGNGTFLDFNGGQTIDFSRFSVPTRISKFVMKEFWAVNENTIWENGRLKVDTDGDGLSDDMEATLGSNPNKADSDGNGVSDEVEYKVSGKPCQSATCTAAGANPYTSCVSLQQPAGSPLLYLDTDGDNLNDCEEKLLGSNAQDFDSNLDYVPDDMALRTAISVTGATNLNLDPDFDGLSNYMELKYNSPIFAANSGVAGLKLIQMTSNLVSSNETQDCYSMTVDNVASGTKFDNIRLYLLENTQSFTQKRILRMANVQMVGGAVSARDTDFVRVGH